MSRKSLFIPKLPELKPRTYTIPSSYVQMYEHLGITNRNEQMMLFHLTQFGGFKLKPSTKTKVSEEFLRRWFRRGYDLGNREFKASTEYLDVFFNLDIEPLERIWRIKAVNEKSMSHFEFSDSEIEEAKTFLKELNDFYSDVRLALPMPKTGISLQDRVQLATFNAIPFLYKSPSAGGRFFQKGSSYINLSKVLRPNLTINGDVTSEIDISAAVLQFLNAALNKARINSVDDTLFSFSDPYEYFLSKLNSEEFLTQHREKPIERDHLKDILYTLIYSSEEKQARYTDRKLRRIDHSYTHATLVSTFPDFFDSIRSLKQRTGRLLHHTVLKEESLYAQAVLQKGCLEEGIPILPIHDSFISRRKDLPILTQILDDTSWELYGRKMQTKQKY